MNAAIASDELTEKLPLLPAVTLTSGFPRFIFGALKKVARKEKWSLERWCQLSEKLNDCFDNAASEGASERFLAILGEHFDVTLAPSFSWDSRTWDITTTRRSIWPDE